MIIVRSLPTTFHNTICWKDYCFCSWCTPGILAEDELNTYVWIYFWTVYSVPLVNMMALPVPYSSYYSSFIIYFKIRKCFTSSFVILSQGWYSDVYLWSFVISYELQNCLSISVKNTSIEIESIDWFGQPVHLNNPWTQDVWIFTCKRMKWNPIIQHTQKLTKKRLKTKNKQVRNHSLLHIKLNFYKSDAKVSIVICSINLIIPKWE